VSLNVHAAANPGAYVGTDFSSAQAASALRLAQQGGNAHLRILDDSFAAFAQREDLPAFDSISLHGIWSWISADNQRLLLSILQQRVKPGGVVYVSYNCMPGWANVQPLQKLLWLYDHHLPQAGDDQARIQRAIELTQGLFATQPAYVQAAGEPLHAQCKALSDNPTYLAHEYLNDHWQAPYFSDVAQAMREIRLDFACSSNVLLQLDALYLTEAQRALLSGVASARLREQLFDYCVNTQFRTDLYVRGVQRLSPEAQRLQLADQDVVLCVPAEHAQFKVQTHLGEFAPHDNQYDCVRDVLAADGACPKRLGDVLDVALQHGLNAERAMRAIVTLAGNGSLLACQPSQARGAVASRCRAFNLAVCAHAIEDEQVSVLASPVTGAGIGGIDRTERLFTLAHLRGQDAVALAQDGLQRAGATLVDAEDKPITDAARIHAQLQRQYQEYQIATLPLLSALGIV